ncbi:MAG: prolyl oligopeptidase family serine peptidase [Pseudomonadota bacterium]
MLKSLAISIVTLSLATAVHAQEGDDPYLWLEEIESDQALSWARAQNARTKKELLDGNETFDTLYREALEILTSDARLPLGQIHNGAVYNFWQDEIHVRGVWRRASTESYVAGTPEWETLIDFDVLAKEEDENWIRGGTVCLAPEYRHCMVEVSYGGKDAGVWREFDTVEKTFVEGGFFIPEAKSNVAWFDKDLLIVGTDIGDDALTESGYPRQLRSWERGETLKDAPVIFEGEKTDVSVAPIVEHDGEKTHLLVRRALTFFEYEYTHAEGAGDPVVLPTPLNATFQGILDGRAVFFLRDDWSYGDAAFENGAVISYHVDEGVAEAIFSPSPSQAVESVGLGSDSIIIQYLDNVAGKAARFKRELSGDWVQQNIDLPENGMVSLVSSGGGVDDALLSFESMTTPDSLYFVTAQNDVSLIQETPALYDATDVVVEQRFATSTDGTKVPYFLLAKKSVLEAGDAPTIQYGYGGFLIAELPKYYSDPGRPQHGALAGKLWVSRGGVLVVSNIRGGSEFGPRWHQAALKENRQRSFDDFIAISEHLIETGVTTPEKLGAVGRSNGGLLMGAMLTQRPDLYAALDIGVPLLDMKRYNKLLAGASWMGEYGNPDIDDEWAYISLYSPYQLVEAGQAYPKVLFYTSTKDDRVHPGHARKTAAKMGDLGYDFFYYENIEGGHGGTANQDQLAYRTALEYAYFAHMLMSGQAGEGTSDE